jgi:hypothetical protein
MWTESYNKDQKSFRGLQYRPSTFICHLTYSLVSSSVRPRPYLSGCSSFSRVWTAPFYSSWAQWGTSSPLVASLWIPGRPFLSIPHAQLGGARAKLSQSTSPQLVASVQHAALLLVRRCDYDNALWRLGVIKNEFRRSYIQDSVSAGFTRSYYTSRYCAGD